MHNVKKYNEDNTMTLVLHDTSTVNKVMFGNLEAPFLSAFPWGGGKLKQVSMYTKEQVTKSSIYLFFL